MIKKLVNAVRTYIQHKRLPLHVEFNIIDNCNLNCKGCSHYSPMATDSQQPLSALIQAMEKVGSIQGASSIREVFLIGGETLLYRHIEEAMIHARRCFPTQTIKIFTNGLLIPRMTDRFWQTCRQTDTVMAITRYPVKFDYDNAIDTCRRQGVRTEIFGDRSLKDSFFKFPLDEAKKENKHIRHFRCTSFGCITIDNGRIFPCAQSACVHLLNKAFNTDFQWENGDYINLDDLHHVRQIRRLRNKPVPFCGYCAKTTTTTYGPSRRHYSEWSKKND